MTAVGRGSDDKRMMHRDRRQRSPVVLNRVHGDRQRLSKVHRTQQGRGPTGTLDPLHTFAVQK